MPLLVAIVLLVVIPHLPLHHQTARASLLHSGLHPWVLPARPCRVLPYSAMRLHRRLQATIPRSCIIARLNQAIAYSLRLDTGVGEHPLSLWKVFPLTLILC